VASADAVGTQVVASDFAVIRRVVIVDPDDRLGALCDPEDDEAVAAAFHGDPGRPG
jgi:hypothetical protein